MALKEDFNPNLSSKSQSHTALGHNAVASAINDTLDAGNESHPEATATTLASRIGQLMQHFIDITGTSSWYDSTVATILDLWNKFNDSTGHKHTGAANDAPPITGIGAGIVGTSLNMDGNPLLLDTTGNTKIESSNSFINIYVDGFTGKAVIVSPTTFSIINPLYLRTDTITEFTGNSGVTIEGVLLKDNGILLPNNTPYQIKNAGGTAKNVLNKNASDQTTIGENNVRPTRFVAVHPAVQVLSTDPANTNWTALDVTANTSARAFAIIVSSTLVISSGTGESYAVATGDTQTADATTRINRTQVVAVSAINTAVIPLDTSQSFDWSVNSANVTGLVILITGYWEYVD